MDRTQGHWAKFSDAARDIEAATPIAELRSFFACAMYVLAVSQRFYLPDAVNIFEGRQYDDAAKELIKLPYDCVALLSETHIEGTPTWKITLAFDPEGDVNTRFNVCKPMPPGSIPMFSIVKNPRPSGVWGLFPLLGGMFSRPNAGYDLTVAGSSHGLTQKYAEEFERHSGGKTVVQEFWDDAIAITNLCGILSLCNASKRLILPPAALNRMRVRKGKKPLYDYHVLVVDGETWDCPHVTTNTGNGVRSHLRRGHIRRLDETRRVWVRATYVHGSVPGFVDKDYKVEPPIHHITDLTS